LAAAICWHVLDIDCEMYRVRTLLQNGDMHLVCPKYIAFKGPSDKREKISPGLYTLTPANYIDVFTVRSPHCLHSFTRFASPSFNIPSLLCCLSTVQAQPFQTLLASAICSRVDAIKQRKGVTAVVRLNEPDTYNAAPFVEAGVIRADLRMDELAFYCSRRCRLCRFCRTLVDAALLSMLPCLAPSAAR
jgi:hypothetical protein